MDTFGEQLRTWRQENGWAQESLAQRAGVSVATISRTERGKSNASQLLVDRLRQLGFVDQRKTLRYV